jgi:hypothetical protein
MQERNGSYLDRRERVRRGDKISADPPGVVTRIPNQARSDRYVINDLQPQVYRQTRSVILETPEIERHLNHIAAGTIVTILGSWLIGSMFKSRAFTILTYIMIFFASTTLAGLLIGIMLGEGFISSQIVLVLLLGLVSISIVALLILLGGLIFRSTQRSR